MAHGLYDLVERSAVLAIIPKCHAAGIDGFDRTHRVALDAGDLHQAADRIAGESEAVLYAAFDGMLDLMARAASAATSAPTAVGHATPTSRGVDTRFGPQ